MQLQVGRHPDQYQQDAPRRPPEEHQDPEECRRHHEALRRGDPPGGAVPPEQQRSAGQRQQGERRQAVVVHDAAGEEPLQHLRGAVGVVFFGLFDARAIDQVAIAQDRQKLEAAEQRRDQADLQGAENPRPARNFSGR